MRKLQGSIVVVLMCSASLLAPIQGLADSGSKAPDSIPLFASFFEKDKAVLADEHALSDRPMASIAASASRIAQVSINQDAIDAQKIAPGAVVAVGLFDNTSLEAEIDKVEVSNKTTTIRGEIKGSDYGHIITTVYENKVLTVIELPAEGYQYKIVYDNDSKTHFLYKTPLSKLDTLEGGPSLIPPDQGNDSSNLFDINAEMVAADTPATIDVMVVYTPAAASWAAGNGGINNIISQAMAKAQLALGNSNTLINMRLVHSAQVAYTESGSYNTDLNLLTSTTDGFMDEVHTWRDQYGADLVAIFTLENVTGGVGWLLQQKSGRPQYAFCLIRVQQAGWTLTHIHEMGHNMGAHHHKQQTTQPGPTNWGSSWVGNTWSAGWRWDESSASPRNGYCTLMSYESGFPDSKTYYRVAHFSNPSISYQGVATGDSVDGDNARTLREIRNVIAGYRPTASAPECTIDADCSSGEVCLNNECVECADDGDCTGGTCESNVCIPYECTVDGDCTGGEVCSNNTCVECANNTDCDGGDVCSNNICVECANNTDCDGGDVCSNNTCVECAHDTDCDGGDVCSNNVCVECADDGDCTGGTCESNVCIPYECTVDGDCTGGEVCFNHECVECADATDCDDGAFCNGAERCTGGTCFSGTEPCEAGELCNEDADECDVPPDCEEDADCDVGVCVEEECVECRIDGDCSGEVCSEDNVCVECVENNDCPDGVCSNNMCVECIDDEDCIGGVCRDNVCVECLDGGDCTSGICLANKCIDCVSDFDCHGDVCLENFCVECAHDDDCIDGICLDNMCTGCKVDADCERGTCIDNMCVVEGSVQMGKFTVKAGKNGKGDSIVFSGLLDASVTDFNEAWAGNVIVTIEAENIPDPALTTFTFPIENDYLKNYKYKSPKVTPIDKSAPVSSLQIDTIKGKMKFSGKNLDLTGLRCPITLRIQIGIYTAERVLDEIVVNGTKPCPPEFMINN